MRAFTGLLPFLFMLPLAVCGQLSVDYDYSAPDSGRVQLVFGAAAGAEWMGLNHPLNPALAVQRPTQNTYLATDFRMAEVNSFSFQRRAQPEAFDFTRTAPHLAFFCRLEINEKAGFVIPAKFRLGGHRHWQDEL